MRWIRGRCYDVTWHDTEQDTAIDWVDEKKVKIKPLVIRTCGYFLKKENGYICLVQMWDRKNTNISSQVIIPIGMVVQAKWVV
jgi:hypothetical protein